MLDFYTEQELSDKIYLKLKDYESEEGIKFTL